MIELFTSALPMSTPPWVPIASVIASWLASCNSLNSQQPSARALVTALDRITDPLYRPVRKLLPDFGGLDFSPIVILLAISILRRLLGGIVLELGPTIS